MISGDASEFYRLATNLAQVGAKSVPAMRGVMSEAGTAFRDEWRSRADAHFGGGHAKKYPASITSDLALSVSSIDVEVGPSKSASNQGFLGQILEFGGEHSPAYLDGLSAMQAVEPRVERMADEAVGRLFG